MSGFSATLASLTKRVRLAAGIAALCGATAVHAAYPEKPITLVVSYPPGGTVDLVARLLGPELEKILGQPVVVENKGGAGGMIGGHYVARAQPDGYTLLMDASNHAQNPALREKMSFDTQKDFTPVSLLIKVPNVLVVHPESPIRSVSDVKEQDKASGNTLYFASSGPGSAQHLAGELFNVMAGTPPEIVDTLSAAFAKAVNEPSVRKRLEDLGADVIGSSPEELGKFVNDEIAKWRNVAQQAKISLE